MRWRKAWPGRKEADRRECGGAVSQFLSWTLKLVHQGDAVIWNLKVCRCEETSMAYEFGVGGEEQEPDSS